MKKILFILILIQPINLIAQESILTDSVFILRLKTEVDSIYNFQFENTEKAYMELEEKYPDHAFTQLFYALMLYWKYFPIVPESKYHDLYVQRIEKAIASAEKILDKDKSNSEAIFFNLMGRMLLMQYYADNGVSSKVIPHLGRAYKMVTAGFDLKKDMIDFNFTTGVYNYYSEAYPEAHPIYKPVAYFFPKGNIKLGLQQLEYNWQNGIFLDAESLFFLVYINLNFEKNYPATLQYLEHLNTSYPNNPLYISYRIQTLLITENYDFASDYINKLKKIDYENDFFLIVSNIYEAIILEKQKHNYLKATKIYAEALKDIEKYGDFGNQYSSFAFYGLSRIYHEKDKKKEKEYRKIANELSVYPHINFD
jgi:tetratricopeptide (TPR) repeat protein